MGVEAARPKYVEKRFTQEFITESCHLHTAQAFEAVALCFVRDCHAAHSWRISELLLTVLSCPCVSAAKRISATVKAVLGLRSLLHSLPDLAAATSQSDAALLAAMSATCSSAHLNAMLQDIDTVSHTFSSAGYLMQGSLATRL